MIKNKFPLKSIKEKALSFLAPDLGIDLGTANTLVYVKGRGIVVDEPSIVALNTKTNQVVAIGKQAKDMLGRTPAYVKAVQPVVDGVISDFEVTQEMLYYLIKTATKNKGLLGPRTVVGVPSGITNVEVRAVEDAAKSAGAREVFIVEEPMAAAIGIGLPIENPEGHMIVDIGGGTTDIAVISLGGIVNAKNIPVAGDLLDEQIANYIRDEFKVLVGKKTAEQVKKALSSAVPLNEEKQMSIRGRYLVSGLPREVVITDSDVREAILPSLQRLVDAIKETLEITPPEIVADIMKSGIYLTGGGALIKGLDEFIKEDIGFDVKVAEEPLTAVVRGTSIILDDPESFKDALVSYENTFTY